MSLNERINEDFLAAFKAKEMGKKDFLGLIRGEIKTEQLRGTTITDETVLAILRKMEKSLRATNTSESLGEIEYLVPYLPVPMSEEKIREIITGYKNSDLPSTIGRLMGEFNKEHKGRADNSVVSRIVKEVIDNEVNG